MTMSGVQQPRPEPHGGRRPPDLVPLLIDRWAQLAMQRPWRYLATSAVGIGVANLGLRMLLNDLSLAHNARLAILTAVGFSTFAWLYTAQLTRPLRRRRPNLGANPAVSKQSCAAHWRSKPPSRQVPASAGPRSGPLWSCPRRGETFTWRGRRPSVDPDPGCGDGAWSSPRSPLQPLRSPWFLAPPFAKVLHPVEVPMWSSQARGVEGHQWRLHGTSGTRLPCRIVCQCGWTSAAGTSTSTLLELKGHLEDNLHNGARLIRRQD